MACQKKAWVNHHRNECQNLKKVFPKIPTDTVRLMARIIFKLKEGGLKKFATLPDGSHRYFEVGIPQYGNSHSEKSEEFVKNTTAASKYIPRRPRISIN